MELIDRIYRERPLPRSLYVIQGSRLIPSGKSWDWSEWQDCSDPVTMRGWQQWRCKHSDNARERYRIRFIGTEVRSDALDRLRQRKE